MKLLQLNTTNHVFKKVNLVTTKGGYDILKCSKCGLTGKRYGITETLRIDGRISDKRIYSCSSASEYIGKKIRITNCHAVGKEFSGLTPDSIHEIVSPPDSYKNGDKGVWVFGFSEPVKVLFNEFELVD